MMKRSQRNGTLVYVQFPRTGLGNMLLVWARAFVFARLNGLPLVTSGWGNIHWGAWLRWERKKRTYWGYFRENGRRERASARRRMLGDADEVVREPSVESLENRGVRGSATENTLFVFDEIYTNPDLFGPLRPHRMLVKDGLLDTLTPGMRKKLEQYPQPVISVHIRRGDFKIGNPLTPLEFFIEAIRIAREVTGNELPVTVFTDAKPDEIASVLEMPGVQMAEDKPDILDILLMGRSKMIVLSRSSTFSYWGAFLSDAILVKPWADWQEELRPADVNRRAFEGKVDFQDPASVAQLKKGIAEYSW